MSSNLEITCGLFFEASDLLRQTDKMYVPSEVLEKVIKADRLLKKTHKTLLDTYNEDKEICKDLYCKVRDLRDTSQTYLFYAIETLKKYGSDISSCDFGDVDDYIKEAIVWVERASCCLGCDLL